MTVLSRWNTTIVTTTTMTTTTTILLSPAGCGSKKFLKHIEVGKNKKCAEHPLRGTLKFCAGHNLTV